MNVSQNRRVKFDGLTKEGWFLTWSIDYTEDGNRMVQYPVGLIEDYEGKVHIQYAADIQFIDN